MTPIPIWKTSLASVAVIVGHGAIWFRISWLVLAIMLVVLVGGAFWTFDDIWMLLEQYPELAERFEDVQAGRLSQEQLVAEMQGMAGAANRSTLISFLSLIAMVGGAAMLLVRWCRFAALGDGGDGRWFVFRFGGLELEMLGALVMTWLGFWVAFFVVFAVSLAAVALLGHAGFAVMFALYIALFILTARFCMLFPQVACDGGLDVAAVWRRTCGHTWRIFSAALIVSVITFVIMVVLLVLPPVAWLMSNDFSVFGAFEMEPIEILKVIVPPLIVFSAFANVVFIAAHVFFAAMLGLIHAQLTAAEQELPD